uniref:Probable U2 small nuclear ribonucleoprotein A' n=1 Tax=Acartia pacifica TaxID=335913 RepID=A0A0U2IG20_ACAPC|nr:U2 small nuclear ribonucleoprotein A [Acartia pacifica]
MVKCTPDLIEGAGQYINPVRDRELDLRGYKIPVIENLGSTLDQFDCIDLSDNEVRKLDGFPQLNRLKTLLLNNNRIVRVAEGLELNLPNLNTLVMTNNSLQELADLEPLTTMKKLEMMSLLHNPVVTKRNYRLYVIHKFPSLKVLDFKKIKMKEREAAKALFKTKEGKTQLKDIQAKAKTFVPGAPLPEATNNKAANPAGLTPEQVKNIKTMIAKAKSLEEIERLNQMLRTGKMPGEASENGGDQTADGGETEEMDEN